MKENLIEHVKFCKQLRLGLRYVSWVRWSKRMGKNRYLPLASALIVLREPCQFDANTFCMHYKVAYVSWNDAENLKVWRFEEKERKRKNPAFLSECEERWFVAFHGSEVCTPPARWNECVFYCVRVCNQCIGEFRHSNPIS